MCMCRVTHRSVRCACGAQVADIVLAAMPQLPPKPLPPPKPPPVMKLEGDGAHGVGTQLAGRLAGRLEDGGPVVLGAAGAGRGGVAAASSELSARACADLAEEVLVGLLSDESEGETTARGLQDIRIGLLARLAAHQPADASSTFARQLHDHVTAEPKRRWPLAIAWLHAAFAVEIGVEIGGSQVQSSSVTSSPVSSYDEVARRLLPAMREALPANDRVYTCMLLEVPRLPLGLAEAMVEADLADETRWVLGLSTAQELCLKCDTASEGCLRLLLRMSRDADDTRRRSAIVCLTSQLLPAAKLAGTRRRSEPTSSGSHAKQTSCSPALGPMRASHSLASGPMRP